MAKKPTESLSDRSDPRKNKSLAIRTILAKMPTAKATAIVAAVKKDFGHDVRQNMVYMVKTKANMAADRQNSGKSSSHANSPISSATQWVDAIKTARHLLKATGSVANATALLKAIDG